LKLSVVIISRNEGAELRRTLESLHATLPSRSEIVIVDDSSTDGSTAGLRRVIKAEGIGVARARNLGVSKTSGDLVFFADAHIRVDKRWWQPLAEILEDPKVASVAPAVTHLPATRRRGFGLTFTGPDLDACWLPRQGFTPFAAPILPGCSLMMRRATFDAVGGWDSGLLHRGGVDNEMSVRLWLLGYELMIAPQVVVPHLFRSASPYPVGWPQYLHNRLRLAFAHLSAPRLAKVVKALHKEPAFGEAMELLVAGDISARRRDLLARRARTDDWFFERFGLKW
jgi:glycosyltransferase involved in cell wall biosynthesis